MAMLTPILPKLGWLFMVLIYQSYFNKEENMMNDLQVFKNEEINANIRAVDKDSEKAG